MIIENDVENDVECNLDFIANLISKIESWYELEDARNDNAEGW